MAGGELRARQRAQIVEQHIAGEENVPVLVPDLHRGGARHMAGGMKDDLDVVVRAAEMFGVAKGQARQTLAAAIDLVVGKQRIVGDVFILLLPEHDVRRIVEHPLDQHPARRRHDDRRVGELPHDHGQAADVVEVAVRDDDQVQRLSPQRLEVRRRHAAHPFGMQPAVDQEIEVADLDEQRIGTDAAVAVQVD